MKKERAFGKYFVPVNVGILINIIVIGYMLTEITQPGQIDWVISVMMLTGILSLTQYNIEQIIGHDFDGTHNYPLIIALILTFWLPYLGWT